MFITREYDYAIRIVRELAVGGKRTADQLSRRENISYSFTFKILKKLEKVGIVKAYRGVHGGYALSKSTSDFTLYDIFKAVGTRLLITACLDPRYICPMNTGGSPCSIHKEFMRLQDLLFAGLRDRSLTEVLELEKEPVIETF